MPSQLLSDGTAAVLKVIPLNQTGVLEIEAYNALLSEKTKLVFVNLVSNALGTVNTIDQIIKEAHSIGS